MAKQLFNIMSFRILNFRAIGLKLVKLCVGEKCMFSAILVGFGGSLSGYQRTFETPPISGHIEEK